MVNLSLIRGHRFRVQQLNANRPIRRLHLVQSVPMQFNRGNHYEQSLVHEIIMDHGFADQLLEVLDSNFLSLDHLKEIVNIMNSYHKEYKTYPSLKLLASIVAKDVESDLMKSECINFLRTIEKTPLNGDGGYIRKSSLDFCRKRSLMGALEKVLELAEDSNYEQVVSTIQKSLELGAERDVGHIFTDHLEERMANIKRSTITTGWDPIDQILGGGLGRGELGAIIAPSGFGKSFFLVNLACAAAKKGLSVVVYTLELNEPYFANPFYALFTRIKIDDLQFNKEKIQQKINELKPKIIIKGYPTKSASVMTLRNHIAKLKLRDFVPDLIVVDYGDLMRSAKNYESKRFEQESVYEDLRGLAQEVNVPCWTASQTNRGAIDDDVISLSKISECYGKVMVSDFMATMSRKNIYVAKNRSGPDNLVHPYSINTSLAKIDIFSAISPELAEMFVNQTDDDKTVLKQKIKEFMQSEMTGGNV